MTAKMTVAEAGSKGGKIGSAKMTPAQRKARAKKASLAAAAKRKLRANPKA